MAGENSLKERVYRCVSGFWVGSSMGALIKGWSPDKVFQKYGSLSENTSGKAIVDAWQQVPGKVTDVVERTKLIGQAIIEKQDRIRAEDLGSVWYRILNQENVKRTLQPYEGLLLEMIRAEIPAVEIGRYCDYSGLNNFACACFPIGLINACDPEHAKEDAENVGRLYQTAGSSGLKWAVVAAVAIASALDPRATVDNVLENIFRLNDSDSVQREISKVLEATSQCKSFEEIQNVFNSFYQAEGIPYAMSFCKETVTKALSIFKFVGGDIQKAVIFGTATGRDADSTASLAASISGALGGSSGLPLEWIRWADKGESEDPYTFKHFSVNSFSEELYGAMDKRIHKLQAYISMLNGMA